MKHLITIILVFTSFFVQAQFKMSFTGSYNWAQGDLKEHYQNGYGIHTELFYQFKDSPWSSSLKLGYQIFEANDNFEANYKVMQQNIFDFDYEIRTYAIPISMNAHYQLFKEYKLQVDVGVGAGVNFYINNIKQVSKHFSDEIKREKTQFIISPQLSIIYGLCDDISLILQGGYNHIFANNKIHHYNTNLGIIYYL